MFFAYLFGFFLFFCLFETRILGVGVAWAQGRPNPHTKNSCPEKQFENTAPTAKVIDIYIYIDLDIDIYIDIDIDIDV